MKPLQLEECAIYFENESYDAVNKHIANANYSSVFILTDSNVHESCLTEFLQNLSIQIPLEVIEIEAGEENKKLSVCNEIWKTLSDLGADRKSLIINLGGGVVTDLGGFIASTYRRGINFIHAPTSLLGMVDASLGGKNGIDLGHLKNQIGTIVLPEMVLVNTKFLETLPQEEYRSGLAEMIKHGLIYSENYFSYFEHLQKHDAAILGQLIHDSIKIKLHIVEADPLEKNLRKTLNFGHTLGHAIESYFLADENRKRLLHGEAIAIGMILESYLSYKNQGLSETALNRITRAIMPVYKKIKFTKNEIQAIIQLLKFDKKNTGSEINFVLLKNIGDCALDQQVSNQLIIDAFAYYQKS